MTDQTVLQVGVGKQYQTINAAITAADQMGGNADIKVDAGTYTNDGGYLWDGINNVTIEGVGGMVKIVDPTYYAGGKAAIVTGGQNIALKNLDISGVTVPDGNGAGIRYDQGTLLLDNVHLHNNQNGILGAADAAGSITIQNSEIDHNGTSAGNTHNIYIGDVANFTLTNSYVHDANVGHEVKSRAENNTITNNRIEDNSGTSSYAIDLPNGGNATITGNVIEQGVNNQNHIINAYGEEGNLHAGTAVTFSNNTVVNDDAQGRGPLWSNNGATITGTGNTVWNNSDLGNGVSSASVTTVSSRPTLDTSSSNGTATTTPPASTTTIGSGSDRLILQMSEDAWNGDAQFTIQVDGKQIGDTQTATAFHSAGQTQALTVLGTFAGAHTATVTFLNDAYGGTSSTDRNLYVNSASFNGANVSGASLTEYSAGPQSFEFTGPAPASTSITATTIGSGSDRLILQMSEDAWNGDAQFTIQVDGKQIGDTQTATAFHSAGQTQALTVLGTFAGAHTATVTFLNDAYGGTSSTDRNLYVNSASFNGANVSGASLTEYSAGPQSFEFTGPAPASTSITATTIGSGSDRLILQMSEDAWNGDAQFTIQVDGKQIGDTQTATAFHSAGQTQALTVLGTFAGAHTATVTFLNDAYGGTSSTDRNLYVNSASFNGANVSGASLTEYSAGPQSFGFHLT